jgi:hypothetical protein
MRRGALSERRGNPEREEGGLYMRLRTVAIVLAA